MKRKSLKILAGSIAIILIIFILTLTNSFVGNPISQWFAKNAIHEYVSENYQDLDLEVTKPVYNFKFGEYMSKASSKTSEDTNFSILYRNGSVEDNYESVITNKWNTYIRLESEYAKIVEPIIERHFSDCLDMLMVTLDGNEKNTKDLTLDMKLDMENLPLSTNVTLYVYNDELNWENVAQVTLELDALMQQQKFQIDQYSVILSLKNKEDMNYESLGVYDFKQQDLNQEPLAEVMKQHYLQWEEKGMREKENEQN